MLEEPHLPPRELRHWKGRVRASNGYLEYGSGGSTLYALRAGRCPVWSVETDAAYAAEVLKKVPSHTMEKLHLMRVDVGPTKAWGYPRDRRKVNNWPAYPLSVWEEISAGGGEVDTVLIDGRFRVSCFATSLLFAPPGAIILLDDYVGREEFYGPCEILCKPTRRIGRMLEFSVPAHVDSKMALSVCLSYIMDPR